MDEGSNAEKKRIKGKTEKKGKTENEALLYEATFEVAEDFGEVGAVVVRSEHHKELFLHDLLLQGLPNGSLLFTCDSWLQPSLPRVFFSNKVLSLFHSIHDLFLYHTK